MISRRAKRRGIKAFIQVPKIFMDELHQFEIQVILSSYGRIFSPQKTLRI